MLKRGLRAAKEPSRERGPRELRRYVALSADPMPIVTIFPPCSDSSDRSDDGCMWGKATFFGQLGFTQALCVRAILLQSVARIHRHEGKVHVLVRTPLDPDVAERLQRAYAIISAPMGKPSDGEILACGLPGVAAHLGREELHWRSRPAGLFSASARHPVSEERIVSLCHARRQRGLARVVRSLRAQGLPSDKNSCSLGGLE